MLLAVDSVNIVANVLLLKLRRVISIVVLYNQMTLMVCYLLLMILLLLLLLAILIHKLPHLLMNRLLLLLRSHIRDLLWQKDLFNLGDLCPDWSLILCYFVRWNECYMVCRVHVPRGLCY